MTRTTTHLKIKDFLTYFIPCSEYYQIIRLAKPVRYTLVLVGYVVKKSISENRVKR